VGQIGHRIRCRAVLLDLDGVLVDSEPAFERHWRAWAAGQGVALEPGSGPPRGMRTADQVRLLAPHLDAEAEAARIDRAVAEDGEGARAFAGAERLVSRLPRGRWAIVTSSPLVLALAHLRAAGLPVPEVLVTAESVRNGKPDPECYLEACSRLGVAPANAVAVEDSPSGIAAARAAGAFVVAVPTSYPRDQLGEAHLVATLRELERMLSM
jgi:mannitol-1-/sugar-/sorbitol-6-phosphatase